MKSFYSRLCFLGFVALGLSATSLNVLASPVDITQGLPFDIMAIDTPSQHQSYGVRSDLKGLLQFLRKGRALHYCSIKGFQKLVSFETGPYSGEGPVKFGRGILDNSIEAGAPGLLRGPETGRVQEVYTELVCDQKRITEEEKVEITEWTGTLSDLPEDHLFQLFEGLSLPEFSRLARTSQYLLHLSQSSPFDAGLKFVQTHRPRGRDGDSKRFHLVFGKYNSLARSLLQLPVSYSRDRHIRFVQSGFDEMYQSYLTRLFEFGIADSDFLNEVKEIIQFEWLSERTQSRVWDVFEPEIETQKLGLLRSWCSNSSVVFKNSGQVARCLATLRVLPLPYFDGLFAAFMRNPSIQASWVQDVLDKNPNLKPAARMILQAFLETKQPPHYTDGKLVFESMAQNLTADPRGLLVRWNRPNQDPKYSSELWNLFLENLNQLTEVERRELDNREKILLAAAKNATDSNVLSSIPGMIWELNCKRKEEIYLALASNPHMDPFLQERLFTYAKGLVPLVDNQHSTHVFHVRILNALVRNPAVADPELLRRIDQDVRQNKQVSESKTVKGSLLANPKTPLEIRQEILNSALQYPLKEGVIKHALMFPRKLNADVYQRVQEALQDPRYKGKLLKLRALFSAVEVEVGSSLETRAD